MKNSKEDKKILLVLRIPPPYGGGEVRALETFYFFKDIKNYKIITIKRKNESKRTQGKLNYKNIYYSLKYILSILIKAIILRPQKIYISIPKDFLPFLRTSIVIILLNLIGIKIYGELPGMSFLFMKNIKSIKYKYGKYIFKKIDYMRFLGLEIEKNHKGFGFKKTIVFNNGANVPMNYKVSDSIIFDKKLKMLYCGSLERSKGLEILINSLILCKKYNLNFECNFMGEWIKDEEKNYLVEIIEKNKLMENIHFNGLIIGDDKWKMYSNNAILLHPTFWDGQPISILEAIGIGMAIISTRVGAIPETVINGENGIILEENNSESLYNAIFKLYNDRNLLKRYSETNVKKYKNNYRVDIFLNNFKNWLEAE